MASTSGSRSSGEGRVEKTLSRKMTRLQTMLDGGEEEPTTDSERVPSSLASIVPILRVANEIEPLNRRVAYLCRFHAFEKAHNLDRNSSGRGVRQFKTYLLHRLEKEEVETKPQLARSDPREIQKFYQWYYENYVKDGPTRRKPEEMAKHYQIASVLYDVLKTVVPSEKVEEEINRYAREVERKKVHFTHYNILPLHASGAASPIMQLPEIKAAVHALRFLDNLPIPRVNSSENASQKVDGSLIPEDGNRAVKDLLDWLGLVFGFQKGNVENQREHLILLLANVDIRNRGHEDYSLLDSATVRYLLERISKNYQSWCAYLHLESNLVIPTDAATQELELLYIGLYLLIWGESSNIRFMPECICYIFHNMANELRAILFSNVHSVSGGSFKPAYQGEESFLKEVVTPIYQVMLKEAQRNKGGTCSHSKWKNYDDLNEYFWSKECFKLGWPLNLNADFFVEEIPRRTEHPDQVVGRRKSKTNFVEVRTFWHLFRSFDRMWTFFILAFQAMLIIAWSPSGSITAFFDPDVFRSVLSIFLTSSLLNFLQAALDIILSRKAWGSLEYTQIVRYFLKFMVATAWVIILPISYSSSVQNPTGLIKFFSNWASDWKGQPLFNFAVVIYMIPNILAALLFIVPPLRRTLERSNWRVISLLLWWAQPKLYLGRGMHEDLFTLLKYTLFWILLLISKLAFSYYVEIFPLVEPTRLIMSIGVGSYEWHEFFPNLQHNIGVVIAIWAPIILVYFMDAQIWYAIFSTIFGGINGAFSHLGEIRTLGMLRSRFESVPIFFTSRLVPFSREEESRRSQEESERRNITRFAHVWNAFIKSLREEDLISNKEQLLLLVPYSSGDVTVVQWPPFLLASKIPTALDMAKDFKKKGEAELFKKIKYDNYMHSVVIECYETLRDILYSLLLDEEDKQVIRRICHSVDTSIQQRKFLNNFRMSELPTLNNNLEKLLNLLKGGHENLDTSKRQIIITLQDIIEIITRDAMINGQGIVERSEGGTNDTKQKFSNLNFELLENESWLEKVVRLHLLLTVKESAINVPTNLDARRRITFFANSLFMNMPSAPKVRNMLSFSVLTPYYKEDVLYSEEDLKKENEDGISILFYLEKIYPDEWRNFLERMGIKRDESYEEKIKDHMDDVRRWVSYRGQTLSRTVRGMMYYRDALELQCFLDMAEDQDILTGYRPMNPVEHYQDEMAYDAKAQAITDMKYTYVVSCQVYGMQKKSSEARDKSCYQNILNLMLMYPQLRVAYIDEREETVDGKLVKFYDSVLVKGGDKLDEEIYRIKLPGRPNDIGEGKPENQNHAMIFTRGEALQTIDMNQDNYLEEAFKIRNVLEEFLKSHHGQRRPTIVGLREHIFTGSVSSLAWFMSNQETSFVTIGQRILANPLKVRFHYGHPDVFDRIFHLTRGGVSKASKTINLSEDIFSGFNSTLRGGNVIHREYMQVGKGRDVGMNQISLFEAKVANGNGEQTLSRDVYRLGRRFDFYRMLSFYFTTVGFYFSSMVTRDVPVGRDALLKLDQTGTLLLLNKNEIIWTSNTSGAGVKFAFFPDSGNFILYTDDANQQVVAWESFNHPSDTLLPGQPLSASLELTSKRTPYGYYSLKMLQQQTSLSLALTYTPLPKSNSNYSYWSSPQISNATGEVVAILDDSGNFAIMYGKSAAGTVYVHKNDSGSSTALRRITVGVDGNLHLYQWNSSNIWVSLWSAVVNPCQVAGICGNGICMLDGNSSSGVSCKSLPWPQPHPGDCGTKKKMEMVVQINYYFSGASTIANYSGLSMGSECADHCLFDCDCVATVYGIVENQTYCSTLSNMLFGGLQDPSSTLYMKVGMNQTSGESRQGSGSSNHHIAIILPLLFSVSALIMLLCLFLGFIIKRRKNLEERMLSTYICLPGAPLNFSYHDLQLATCNFSRFLGAGGFGSVYKGSLRDGTLVAVKKLERLLPHGEKEFVTEVTTIGSMHHMNLVNLCGFCSEKSHRLLVYEYMSNGSLDKWIFPSNNEDNRVLEWKTRIQIAVSIAQGIAYFHEQCKNRIIHCDIKPENILLDENFCPKVSDFGLAKLMSREHSHVITMVRGTRGYLAPEWVSNRPITVKADVYSYGMVLLEIIGGRRNLDISLDEDEFFYPGLAFKELTDETPMRAVDKRLNGEKVEAEVLVRALRTAFWCIQDDVTVRPSMGEVVKMLEGSVEINSPPMPQAVLDLVEEGLHSVYNAMRRGFLFEPFSSSSVDRSLRVSKATCSHSTMSPR